MSNPASSSDIARERGSDRGNSATFLVGVSRRLKRVAALDLKECRLSREEVAGQLSVLCGQRITLAQIDALVAEAKPHRLPAAWIPAWVRVTQSARLLELLIAGSGFTLADQTERDLAEMARAEIRRDRAARDASDLRERLEVRI
jgi:hypothetical protein